MENDSKQIDIVIEDFERQIFKTAKNLQAQHGHIIDLLYLEDQYDNPDAVLQAIDAHASIYAYYAKLFHHVNSKVKELEQHYNIWKSAREREIQQKLFSRNMNKGMTANNARPSAADINNYFNTYVTKTEGFKKWQKRLLKYQERLSQLRIMRDTVDRRSSVITTMSSLLGKCIDSGIISTDRLAKSGGKGKISLHKQMVGDRRRDD